MGGREGGRGRGRQRVSEVGREGGRGRQRMSEGGREGGREGKAKSE